MTRRNPEAYPLDDKRVYDAYIAGRQSAALTVGVRSGLFDALAERPMSAAEIGERFGWGTRPVASFVSSLVAMGFVEREGETLRLADDVAAYATRGRPGSLWALIDMEVENFLSPAALLKGLEADGASVYDGEDPWEAHERDPDKARAFTLAMHSVSERPAAGLAESVPLDGVTSLLDVGGGSGAISIALAAANERLNCTIMDLPVVCRVAEEIIEDAGLSGRVTTTGGNMFEAWPAGHDGVLLSQILHDWSFETGRKLLARAREALPVGGTILIHEKLVDDDRDAPLANALVHLDMLVWTEGQQYRFVELQQALEESGFGAVRRIDTAGYWSAVVAEAV